MTEPEIRIGDTPEDAVDLAVDEWRSALDGGTLERPRRAASKKAAQVQPMPIRMKRARPTSSGGKIVQRTPRIA